MRPFFGKKIGMNGSLIIYQASKNKDKSKARLISLGLSRIVDVK